MKAHNVGFENYIEPKKKLLKEDSISTGVPAVDRRLDRIRNDDSHKFSVLMDEIEKSGFVYALNSYYGLPEALRLIEKFKGAETAQAAAHFLNIEAKLRFMLDVETE